MSTALRFIYAYRQRHRFSYRLKWVQYPFDDLFICNVKKTKGVAHKSGDIDGTCKQA